MAPSIETITAFQYNHLKLLLCRQPNCSTIKPYVEELRKYNANTIIKACESSNCEDLFDDSEIDVRNFTFQNGSFPSNGLIEIWIDFVKKYFEQFPDASLGIHCVDGLGRSAVLVALALIEGGLDQHRTIELIKSKRRGAFNRYQEEKLIHYKSQNRLVISNYNVKG
ncbi:hypothetical protein RI129_011703 [Pyrocoelia pectoralis]|uniref:Protein tyrosine phosphatase type IVA 3 n=1 Tax=Pyrocoelia pectoralis TaxID=417401 RepID=A0AAN7V663_9COLE